MTDVIDPVEVMARAIARTEHDALQVGGVGEGLEAFGPEVAFDCYMDHARAALTAAEAAGMVWVPKEATPAMIEAGYDRLCDFVNDPGETTSDAIYAAMIKARPSPTPPEQATREGDATP